MNYSFKYSQTNKTLVADEDEEPTKRFGPLTTSMCPEEDEEEPTKRF